MKRFFLLLTAALMLLSATAAAEGTLNGTYRFSLTDGSRIADGGYLDMALYAEETFDAQTVAALKAGSEITVGGETFTVTEVVETEENAEVYTEEYPDDPLVFAPSDESGKYTASLNDFPACVFVSDYRLTLPLPERFLFSYTDEELPAGEFLSLVSECESGFLSCYNTSVTFENGEIVRIDHYDYPEGTVFGGGEW